MLKFSGLMAGLSIALLPLSTILPAVAVDISPSTGFSGVAIADDSNLVCYMYTTDGRTLNLDRLCGSNVNGSNGSGGSSSSNSSNDSSSFNSPATANAMPVGNLGSLTVDQAIGTPACYGLDAQGLPCPSIR